MTKNANIALPFEGMYEFIARPIASHQTNRDTNQQEQVRHHLLKRTHTALKRSSTSYSFAPRSRITITEWLFLALIFYFDHAFTVTKVLVKSTKERTGHAVHKK